MEEVKKEQKGIFGTFLDAAKEVTGKYFQAKYGQPETEKGTVTAAPALDWRKLALIGVGVLVLVLVLKKL